MLKKSLVSLIKSLLIMVILALVFSSQSTDFELFLKGIFSDVYDYSSSKSQKQVLVNMKSACDSAERGTIVTSAQICTNKTLLETMKSTCAQYDKLKPQGVQVENERQFIESCKKINSGEVERECEKFKDNKISLDKDKLVSVCSDYNSGKLSDGEFFSEFITSPFSGNEIELSSFKALKNYDNMLTKINNNKIIYVYIISFLLALMFLLIKDFKIITITLGDMFFSSGIFIMILYLLVTLYVNFVGLDTSPILENVMNGSTQISIAHMITMLFLMFQKFLSTSVIFVGLGFLIVGVFSKIYKSNLKRNGYELEIGKKQPKRIDKLLNDLNKHVKEEKRNK